MALEKQMELFDDGGLLQEGGSVDEESGNEVPTGSLKKEVRDDIPAQLSEGEFVMPADVVRYHGLDKMMALRDEAKMGLQRMEAMGQMGNADEATIPDGVPFALIDLEIVDENDEPLEMQVGGYVPNIPQQQPYGVVQQPAGQNVYSVPSQFQPQQPVIQPIPFTPTQQPGGYMPVFGPQPTQPTGTDFTFEQLMPTVGGTSETREYRNADGDSLYIPFINGEPIYPIPEGYFPYTPETTTPDTEDTQVTAAPAAQQESDAPTREERIAQKEKNDRIRARKAAAKELGYTKEANAFAGAFKALMPGGMFLGGTEEAGTIMPDGSIADGAGNTFDPISGEQLGGKGFLNLGKEDFPTPESARAFGVTPASQAGLMSLESEKSLDEFRTPTAVTPETTKVETTLDVTAQPGTTAGDVAQAQVQDRMSAMTEAMDNLGLTGNQREDFLKAVLSQKEGSIPFATSQGIVTVDFTPRAEAGAAGAEMSAAQNLLDAVAEDTDAGLPSTALAAQRVSDDLLAATPDPTSDLLAGEPGAEIGSASYRQQRDIENKISAAKTADPSQYAKDVRAGVYDSEFDALDKARAEVRLEQNSQNNKVGTNIRDEYGDEVASKVRDDQGTVGSIDTDTGDIYYDSSHDWSQKTQTNVQDDPPAKAQETSDSRDDAKIVCTEMYRQTQLADWKEAIKIWGVYEKKYLTPYHEKGYHWLFMPWVKGMRSSNTLTSVGAYLARARTQHLKHVMTKGKAPDNIIGNIWCKIVHPLTYLTGRMLSWQKK